MKAKWYTDFLAWNKLKDKEEIRKQEEVDRNKRRLRVWRFKASHRCVREAGIAL